jgi:hypothetical protein
MYLPPHDDDYSQDYDYDFFIKSRHVFSFICDICYYLSFNVNTYFNNFTNSFIRY